MPTAYPRYVRKDCLVNHDSYCLLCGSCYGICQGEPRACRVTTCLACGSPQCMVNGLGRGQCGVCLVGLLPGWSGADRECEYAGCKHPAIARVDGANKSRCRLHLERGKWAGYVLARLGERALDFILTTERDVPCL